MRYLCFSESNNVVPEHICSPSPLLRALTQGKGKVAVFRLTHAMSAMVKNHRGDISRLRTFSQVRSSSSLRIWSVVAQFWDYVSLRNKQR